MAGRGRGSLLLNEILNSSRTEEESNSNIRETTKSPLALLGLRSSSSDNPLPCAGRGLMTPNQFMKTGQNIPSRPGISEREPVTASHASPTSAHANTVVNKGVGNKPQALIDAERYLQSCEKNPLQVPQYKPSLQPFKKIQAPPQQAQYNSYGHKIGSSSSSSRPNKQATPDPAKATKAENEEAEADWQRFKFQRQINRILSKVTVDDVEEVVSDLKLKLEENSLSEKFPQYNELRVILETLVEKVIVSDDFIKLGSILIRKIADADIVQFQVIFPKVMSMKMNEVVKVTASDNAVTTCTRKFCKLLGTLFGSTSEEDKKFHNIVATSIEDCIEQWTYPDGIGDEIEGFHVRKAETNAYAAKLLLDQVFLMKLEGERVNEIKLELKRTLSLIRESNLNECLPRAIREVYLDILLASAKNWLIPENSKIDTEQTTVSNVSIESDRTIENIPTVDVSSKPETIIESESISNQNEYQSGDTQVLLNPQQHSESASDDKGVENVLSCQSEAGESQDASVIIEDEEQVIVDDNQNLQDLIIPGSVDKLEKLVVGDKDYGTETSSCKTEDDLETESSDPDLDFYKPPMPVDGERQDPYHNVKIMMKKLNLEDQMVRFENNFIRDTVLNADQDVLKAILKEAGFPAGLIYEICVYIEDNITRTTKSSKSGSDTDDGTESQFDPASWQNKNTYNPKEAGQKKKLLGIGRGGSYEPSRGGNNQRGHNNRGRSGPDRQFGNPGRSRDSNKFWKGSKGVYRGNSESGYADRKGLPSDNSWSNDNRDSSYRVNRDDRRQIGKVEPIRKLSREEKKISNNGMTKAAGFDGVPPGCLRCGGDDHYSHDCKNYKAVFFG